MTDPAASPAAWQTPPPEDFDAPRPPGPGALLLFTVAFSLMMQIFMAVPYALGFRFPVLHTPVVMVGFALVFTLAWAGAAWFWVSVRALPLTWLSFTPTRAPIRVWVLLALLVPVTLVFGSNLDTLVLHAFPSLHRPDAQMEVLSEAMFEGPLAWVLVIGLGVVAAPVCEELFFRGVVLRSLRSRAWGPLPAMAFTAALFSAVHLKVVGFLLLFTVGFVLAALAEASRALFLPILFHALYNGLVLSISLGAQFLRTPELKPFSLTPPEPAAPALLPVGTALLLLGLTAPLLAWLLFLIRRALRPAPEVPS